MRVTETQKENETLKDGLLVCFDVRLKSTVPMVLRASSSNKCSFKSVYEILQVMLTDQNAVGSPVLGLKCLLRTHHVGC